MGILSGVISYLFGLALNLLDAAIGGFLGALGFDLNTFESYFPAAREFHEVFIGFAVGLQFLKLTVECVERYIVFYFVLYCAPVVFATGAFKSTAQVFKSWCRMLALQAILLLLNIWSIKLFLSFMPVFERNTDDIIFNFLLGYAFLKFAQKADTLLRILGLNTASTGDMMRSFLGGTIAGIAMAVKSAGKMTQGVSAAAGRMFGGSSKFRWNHRRRQKRQR